MISKRRIVLRTLFVLALLGTAFSWSQPQGTVTTGVVPLQAQQPQAKQAESEQQAEPKNVESGFGDFTGQFILEGDMPKLEPVATADSPNSPDLKACGLESVANEKLIVDPKSKGIANIFVYLPKVKQIHPSYEAKKGAEISMTNRGCRFEPRCAVLRTNQNLVIKNLDPVLHHAHEHPNRNSEYGKAFAPGERDEMRMKFRIAEKLPIYVTCDIHRWMIAYLLVLDHPYAAITDKEGKFRIEKLPAGEYDFIVWHESVGYIHKKLKVEIKSVETHDLGVQNVAVDKFKL